MPHSAASSAVTPWARRMFAVTLFVDDVQRSRRFYVDVFGMPILVEDEASVAFGFPNLVVNLVAVPAARELVEPADVGRAGTAARMMLTLDMEDVDAVCERLRELGVELLNGPIDRSWGPRTAAFADPSGHCWELSSHGRER